MLHHSFLRVGEDIPLQQVLLENLQVLLESDIILLEGKYSVLGNFLGRNTFFQKLWPLLYKRAELDLSSFFILGLKFISWINSKTWSD